MTDAELVQLLEDVRPRAEAPWAARLDAQVARGFANAPKRPRRTWARWRVPTLALGTACAVVLLIVVAVTTRGPSGGFSGGNGSSAGGSGGSASSERSPSTAAPSRTARGGSSGHSANPVPAPLPSSAAAPAQRRD